MFTVQCSSKCVVISQFSVGRDVILHLPLALLMFVRLAVEKSLQRRRVRAGLAGREWWVTYTDRVEVCIQGEIFTQSVGDLLLDLFRGGVHGDVQVRIQILGDSGNIRGNLASSERYNCYQPAPLLQTHVPLTVVICIALRVAQSSVREIRRYRQIIQLGKQI